MSSSAAPRILCVDDEAETLTWLRTLLEGEGFAVNVADGGRAALDLASKRPLPDLFLLDAVMPGLDGYQVCESLQKNPETSYIPVVFLTARGGEQDKARAFAAGAVEHLVKPADPEELVGKVRLHLSTRSKWMGIQRLEREGAPTQDTTTRRRKMQISSREFAAFKGLLVDRFKLREEAREQVLQSTVNDYEERCRRAGISGRDLAQALADGLHLEFFETVDPAQVRLGVLPTPFCRSNRVVALRDEAGRGMIVVANPFRVDTVDAARSTWSGEKAPGLAVAPEEAFQAFFSGKVLPPKQASGDFKKIENLLQKEYRSVAPVIEVDESSTENSAPIIQLVDALIDSARKANASDIHIEPWEEEVVVRFRIDGELRIRHRFRPAALVRPIASRIKLMAGLNIADRRLPQDGRIRYRPAGGPQADLDLRVATAPVTHGEKVVLRLLDGARAIVSLEEMGLSDRHLEMYRSKLEAPYGMILHVGPTGSGKTTTLYSALQEISSPEINLQTIEDPVEYRLPGVNQLQVNPAIGLTFPRALRSFLRLDPDVILVGEIRDQETAQIALEAALTGHLLFSTLHTNDAASTVTRLVEMGVPPYLVGASVLMVCAQRLVRRLCGECRESYVPSPRERKRVGFSEGDESVLYRSRGCDACDRSGYKGRTGIHELLVPDDDLRTEICGGRSTSVSLKRRAVERVGMTTLYQDAMEKVRAGVTSLEEVLATVLPDEFDAGLSGPASRQLRSA